MSDIFQNKKLRERLRNLFFRTLEIRLAKTVLLYTGGRSHTDPGTVREKRVGSPSKVQKMETAYFLFFKKGQRHNYERSNLNPLLFQHRLGNNNYENSLRILEAV